LKRYENAIEDFTQAIQLKPDYDLLYYNRGVSYYFIKNLNLAKTDFKKYLNLTEDKSDTVMVKRKEWIYKQFPELFQK
jgi:lipoprotein NlpI